MRPIQIMCLISLIIMSCGVSGSGYKEVPPDEVIRRHIQFLNEKNVDAAESCLVKERRNQIDWQLNSQKSIRLLSIKEETNPDVAKSYMETGRGSITHPFQVKVYSVELEKEYTPGAASFFPSDKNKWYYFVVRQTETSPWLIDDWGV